MMWLALLAVYALCGVVMLGVLLSANAAAIKRDMEAMGSLDVLFVIGLCAVVAVGAWPVLLGVLIGNRLKG
jgi:hypothetical protein